MKTTRVIAAAVLIATTSVVLQVAPAQQVGSRRIDLQRHDLSAAGREVIQVIVEPENYGLAMGTLDDDPGVRPSCHIFVGSKAPWYDITDDLPQFDTFPTSE